VIASPASVAQDVCNRLVEAGVAAILNFAPAILTVSRPLQLRQVDFSVELQVLAFYVAHPEVTVEPEDASLSGL
jgi:redox-sensing transcriptional repressor